MGKEIVRQLDAARLHIFLGDRSDECADVGHDSKMLLVEELLQFRKLGMKDEGRADTGGLDGQQRALAQSEAGAGLAVSGVAGVVDGYDHVVGIVAAAQKNADEGLIVG